MANVIVRIYGSGKVQVSKSADAGRTWVELPDAVGKLTTYRNITIPSKIRFVMKPAIGYTFEENCWVGFDNCGVKNPFIPTLTVEGDYGLWTTYSVSKTTKMIFIIAVLYGLLNIYKRYSKRKFSI